MRLAIFSDVHGNLTALEAVLADVKAQAPDWVLFAGDCCLMGARPAECADLVRETAVLSVYGNTDEWLAIATPQKPDDLDTKKKQAGWQQFEDRLAWTREALGEDRLGWLSRLPFAQRLSPTPNATDDLLMVHANPLDVLQTIQPTAALQLEKTGFVFEDTADEILRPLLENVTAAVLAYGHVHFPNLRQWEGLTLANISSVNLPLDGDPRAKYGLLTWERGSGWQIEQRRVAYDQEAEAAALKTAAFPGWESVARRLTA